MGIPAYGWLVPCAICWFIVLTLVEPEKLEPPHVEEFFRRAPILVKTRDGVVEYVPEGKEKKGDVLFQIALTCYEEPGPHAERLFGWHNKRLYLGLYRLHGKWTYSLERIRFGRRPDDHNPEDRRIPEADREKVSAIVVKVLNERFPGKNWGDGFKEVLDLGIEETSYLCVQNFALAFAYLSILPVIAAAALAVSRPNQEPVPPPAEQPPSSPDKVAVEKTQ